MASDKEMAKKSNEEYQSWKDQGVFEKVPISSVQKGRRIISSHVVYRWKCRGTPLQFLKARVAPHSNKDLHRDLLRVDSPVSKPGS